MKQIFKITLLIFASILLGGILFASGSYLKYKLIVNTEPQPIPNVAEPAFPLIKEVNTFIGTGGYPWVCAHNFPGATMPFGMVRLSPDTESTLNRKNAKNTSGYYYGDNKLKGFSHTRLSGTGATDGGHFLVVPVYGDGKHKNSAKRLTMHYSHRDEVAFPGYYAVSLSKNTILAELTATERVGVHRYTFSKAKEPHLLIDISNVIGDYRSGEGSIKIIPESKEVEGSVRTYGTFASRYDGLKVYFAASFDQDFINYGVWKGEAFYQGQEMVEGKNIGVDFGFENSKSETQIILNLAISYVSIENARANLEAEAANKDFDEILALAQYAWEEKLSLIKIDGATKDQRTIFYTALYRSFQMPTIFNDTNGEYIGFDKQVHEAKGFQYYTDLSLWDTFRTLHPLYNIIAPKEQRDMMVSLVQMAREGGALPRWPSGYGYTGSMLGSPADITISEAWLKGIRDFDIEYAYQSMRKTALESAPQGASYSGRRGVESYINHQYCAADEMDESVSKTLEYAWADYSIGQLALALDKKEDAELFSEHSQYYKNTWNPDTKYFHPRNADGEFVVDFKPLLLTYIDFKEKYTDDYTEGSALQWRWAVPFDASGLISLFDSSEYFVSELNEFFAKADPKMGKWNPGPYYWHGNEPDIYAPYLFNEAGRPDLTQKWVRWILDNKYGTSYKGLDGNDDGATLSSWYIFSSMGFYPMAGSDIYQLGAPLFKEAEINMDGEILKIETMNFSPENIFVKNVWLNGILLDRRWIKHSEIAEGGVLRFEMSLKASE